jgi:hypothetical protein
MSLTTENSPSITFIRTPGATAEITITKDGIVRNQVVVTTGENGVAVTNSFPFLPSNYDFVKDLRSELGANERKAFLAMACAEIKVDLSDVGTDEFAFVAMKENFIAAKDTTVRLHFVLGLIQIFLDFCGYECRVYIAWFLSLIDDYKMVGDLAPTSVDETLLGS